MKLMEWFWPKEMREMVKKFRAEGTLNEKAVEYVNRRIYVRFSAFTFISLIFYFLFGAVEQYIGIAVFILSPLFVKFDIWMLYRNQMAPYTSENRIEATVKKAEESWVKQQKIYIYIDNGNVDLAIALIKELPVIEKEDFPKNGDIISAYISSDKIRAMPDLEYLKQTYSLTTRIL